MKEFSAFLLIGAFLEYTVRTKGLAADDAVMYLCYFLVIRIIYLRQLNKD